MELLNIYLRIEVARIKKIFYKILKVLGFKSFATKKINHYKEKISYLKNRRKELKGLFLEKFPFFKKLFKVKLSKSRKNILLIGVNLPSKASLWNHAKSFIMTNDYKNVALYAHEGKELYQYFSPYEKKKIWAGNVFDMDASNFDVLVYCEVLCFNENDCELKYKLPYNKAKKNYAYSVFDGSILPYRWKDDINNYLDGVFVPIQHLVDVFKNNGVEKPVYELPVALDLEKYLSFYKSNDDVKKVFRFGVIGSLEGRKNINKVLKAFNNAFKDNSQVELIISSKSISNEKDIVEEFMNELKHTTNVSFSCECKSSSELENLMKSFDAYIYCSSGEGYSVTPREALACGHPIVLSAIPAHKSICDLSEEDGVYWVKANIEVPAFQASLNQYVGSNFDCEVDDIVEALRVCFNNRNNINSKDLIDKRKNAVRKYNNKEIKDIYYKILKVLWGM